MKTMVESMARATLPWAYSTEPVRGFGRQEDIDRCLCCCHDAAACDYCDGHGNVRLPAEIDAELLKELLRLRVCKRQIAEQMGVSRMTVYRYARKAGLGL